MCCARFSQTNTGCQDLEKHPLKQEIRTTIDGYALEMSEEEALGTALEIFRKSQELVDEDGALVRNVNVLRVQRSMIEQVCGRLVRRLNSESLVTFFTECLALISAALKKGGDGRFGPVAGKPFTGSVAEMNQVICVMQVLDALYTIMSYEAIQQHVHSHSSVTANMLKDPSGDKKTVTILFMTRLQNMRKLSITPMQKEDEAFVEVWTLLVRYAMRSYTTIICHTQSKLKIFSTGAVHSFSPRAAAR